MHICVFLKSPKLIQGAVTETAELQVLGLGFFGFLACLGLEVDVPWPKNMLVHLDVCCSSFLFSFRGEGNLLVHLDVSCSSAFFCFGRGGGGNLLVCLDLTFFLCLLLCLAGG